MRLFIALPLPDHVRERLDAVQRWVRQQGLPVRLTRAEGLHLTLAFLGETPEARLAEVRAVMDASCEGAAPFALEIDGLGVFPNPRRPRVLWTGLAGDLEQLRRLHHSLSEALRRARFPVEDRPFRPHITLGRAQERWQQRELDALRDLLSAQLDAPGPWRATEAHLMLSELRRDGARYTTLYTTPLGNPLP